MLLKTKSDGYYTVFTPYKNNWLTETGKKFTQLEMEKHWQIIETQKIEKILII